jgi:hypothetical protein
VLGPLILLLISRVVIDYVKVVIDDMSCSLEHLVSIILLPCQLAVPVISLMVLGLINIVFLSVSLTAEISTECGRMTRL